MQWFWGLQEFKLLNDVKYRSMHYYLGVHKFTLLLRMYGEMGWVLIIVRHNILIIYLFNRIPRMGSDRAPRKLFEIMKNAKGIWRLWCLIQNLDKGSHAWETMTSVSLQLIQARMLYYYNIYISSKKDHKPDSYCWRANHALLSSSLICVRPIRSLLLEGHHLSTCHPDTCHRPLRSL